MVLAVFLVLVVLFVVLPLIGMALWAVLTTLVVGLFIGGLGRLVLPGPQRIGLLATAGLGICGSLIGGFLGDHVLGIGWLGTLLLEVGAAALLTVLMVGRRDTVLR